MTDAAASVLLTAADKIYERESELMQRFVRINMEATEIKDEEGGRVVTAEEEEQTKPHEERKQVPDVEESAKKIPPRVVEEELTTKKNKKRRKRSRQEEMFTDKDRAAAVNMGNKDIKQSLRQKRKEDRSRNFMIPEEAEPATFLALGEYEMRRGALRIALDFINKVGSHFTEDKRTWFIVKASIFLRMSVC